MVVARGARVERTPVSGDRPETAGASRHRDASHAEARMVSPPCGTFQRGPIWWPSACGQPESGVGDAEDGHPCPIWH